MVKKLLSLCALFIITTSYAFAAASIYIVPNVKYESLSINNIRYEGITGQLEVGYGGPIYGNYFLAGEVYASPKSINIHNNNGNVISLKPSWDFGGSILPGYIFDASTLLYLRLGAERTHIPGPDATQNGGQLGAGIQFNLNACWDIRGEFNYTWFGKMDDLGKLNKAQYLVGFVFRFP